MSPSRAPGRIRLFRAALRLLPEDVRAEYGVEMTQTFEERWRAAAPGARPAVLVRELQDVAVSSIRIRRFRHARQQPQPERRRMSAIAHDFHHTVRMLRRQPGFTALAALALAIGIGVTTAVFTVVNGVLLRPLPFADPERLVLLMYGSARGVSPWLSPLNYRDYVTQTGVFERAAALTPTTQNLTGGGEPERVPGALVTPGFFDVFGVRMALGRGFLLQDAQAGSRVVILSDPLWRRRFSADPAIVGSTVTLDGEAHTVIGVAPPRVSLPATVEFWQPLVFAPRDIAAEARGAQFVQVFARLRPDVSADAATRALGTVASRFATLYPRTEAGSVAQAVLLQERIVRTIRPTLQLLLVAVSFVLAIACANIAGLLLARATRRGREIGVRVALGAGRGRLVGQLLIESLTLGALGIVPGVVLAWGLVTVLLARAPATLPRLADVRIDPAVLAFGMAVGLATSVAFGLVPAWFVVRGADGRMAGSTRGQVGSSGRGVRRLLVGAEIALAVVLLSAGGLLLRSYLTLRQVDPGFDARQVMTFQVSLPSPPYVDAAAANGFVSRLLPALRAQPGVQLAAAAMGVPFGADLSAYSHVRIDGEGDAPPPRPPAGLRLVSSDYFRAMTIPVVRGRAFEERDTDTSPEVAIVNERFAQRYFGSRDPIGRRLLVSVSLGRGARNGPKTIVGIVGNVKYDGLDEASPAEIYVPYAQQSVSAMTVVVKSAADPAALVPELRRAVAGLDPLLPLANVKPLDELVDASVAARRFGMLLVLLFAGVALVLSAVGLHGVLAHVVAARTAEVGVRLALGASRGMIVWLFAREGLCLTIGGLAAGLAAARASASLIATSLFGVTASDAPTFAYVAATLGVVALCAIAVPVWRATRIDPASLLRTEA